MRKLWHRKDQVHFFNLLGQLLSVGYDLKQAIDMVIVLCPRIRKDLEVIANDLRQGDKLEQLLIPYIHKNIIEDLIFLTLHGEASQLLQEIGRREEIRQRHQQKIRHLLCYPLILLFMVGIVGGVMCQFLLPQITDYNIPVINEQILLIVALGIVSLGVIIMTLRYILRKQTLYQRVLLWQKLPVIGKACQYFTNYQLCLQLGLLLSSGVSLSAIVGRCQTLSKRSVAYEFGKQAAKHLEQGGDIFTFVEKMPLLPDESKLLLSKGNSQKLLGRDFQILAQRKFEQFEQLIQRRMMLIQPMCFLFIAGMIVALYLLMLLPLYSSMGEVMGWD